MALALAGAFLVKYSLDQGWIGPPVRVALAVLLGVTLLGVGEWVSRFPGTVSQGLSAAGVAVLFSSFLAAVQLYQLLSPAVGFGLMAATTALAVVLSLRRGPIVALIGLLGGLLTPYLIRLEEPRAWTLFGYLLLVEGGVLAVSRRRGWTAIALVSLGGGFLWTILWMAGLGVGEPIWPAMFLVATAVVGVAVTGAGGLAWGAGPWKSRQATLVARLAVAGALVLLAVLTGVEGYSTAEWVFLGFLAAGILVLGRIDPRFELLPPVAGGAVAVLLATWLPVLEVSMFPRFAVTAAALTALFAVGAFLALWGARRPTVWGWLSAASGVAGSLLVYLGAAAAERDLLWGALALLLALIYAGAAWSLLRSRTPEREHALGALAWAAGVLTILALFWGLEDRALILTLSLTVPLLVAVGRRLTISTLRSLAWMAAFVVFGLRLLTEPILGGRVAVPWLCLDFAVPVAAFLLASWILGRSPAARKDLRLSRILEEASVAFGLAFVLFLLHRIFLPGRDLALPRTLNHWGALVVGWTLLACFLLWRAKGEARPARLRGAALVAVLAAVTLVGGPVLAANPAWTSLRVAGWPIVNGLLWAYGVPALLFFAFGLGLRQRRAGSRLVAAFHVLALVLLFVLVTLEVRQAFRGPILSAGATSHAEQYAYSAAWIVLSTLLLVVGIARRVPALRWAALAVMVVTVGKVFLYDTAHLSDLLRVLSYLGLGLSLMLLAWLYQRFVFRSD